VQEVLANRRILVLEDEVLIALDLSFAIEDAGGMVAGPVDTAEGALRLINEKVVQGAILDVNLVDGDSTLVVERLIELDKPFIIQTGLGLPAALAARFPDLTVHFKPSDSGLIVRQLLAMIEAQSQPNAIDCNPPGALST
jgi:DNA-binding NtrC family response regulator